MAHTPKYLNNVLIGPAVSFWAHIFQARQFKGKGDFKFDIGLVINQDQLSTILPQIQKLAAEAFPAGEYNLTDFQWPFYLTNDAKQVIKHPKISELFPNMYRISAKAFQENPPQVLVPNAQGQVPRYIPMPDTQRSTLVYDGAVVHAGLDFASYYTGDNFGIRVQLAWVLYNGAGAPVSIGSRPDAVASIEAAGLDVQMQAPQGLPGQAPQGLPGQVPIAQGMPTQPMPGQVPQQAAPAQQAANPFAPQQAAPAQQAANPGVVDFTKPV